MLTIQFVLGILAGALSFIAYIPYISSILKGKTKPNRASWWIWAAVGWIIFASYFSVGARSTIWYSLPIGISITAILSLKYGEGGLKKLDLFCLGGAALGLLVWWLSGIAFSALLVAIAVDMFAYLPTIDKSRTHPGSEDRIAWILFWIGAFLNIAAIGQWTLEIALYPLYILVLNSIVLWLLIRKPQKKKPK